MSRKIVKHGIGAGAQEAGGQFESFIALLCSGTKLGGANKFTDVQVIERPEGKNYLKIGDLSLKLISANTPNKQSFITVYEHFSTTDNPMQFLVAIKGGDPRIASAKKQRKVSIDLFLSEFTKQDYNELIKATGLENIPKFDLKGDIGRSFGNLPTKNADTEKAYFIAPNQEVKYALGFGNKKNIQDQSITTPQTKFGDQAERGFVQKGGSNGSVIFKDLGEKIASLLLDGENMKQTKINKVNEVNSSINTVLNLLTSLNKKLNVFWTKSGETKEDQTERFNDALSISKTFEQTSLEIYSSFYKKGGFGRGRGKQKTFDKMKGLAVQSKTKQDYGIAPTDDGFGEHFESIKALDQLILEILQESLDK